MNLSLINKQVPRRLAVRSRAFSRTRGKVLATASAVASAAFLFAGQAIAQGAASSSTGSLGDQMNKITSEGMNAGGIMFAGACYVTAIGCFFFGLYALWMSRQPQNRESGFVARGVVGMVVAGALIAAPSLLGKASQTASGGAAGISTSPNMVSFGGG